MKKNTKLSILVALIFIFAFIILRNSMKLHKGFKEVKLPTKESRQFGNMSTYKWITVKKLVDKYNISEEDIFKDLEITPEKGDEYITIKELREKYNKTPEEMKRNLKKIIENHRSIKGKEYE